MDGKAVDLAILGLARDCAQTLPSFLRLVAELEADGISSLVIVGENGSRDGTRALLLQAARRGVLRVEDTGFMAREPRFRRMALGRQALADALRGTGIASEFVCVLDLDAPMRTPPNVASLRRAMSRLNGDPDIFAVAATSRPSYYDLIAFDDGRICFEGLARTIKQSERNPIAYYRLFDQTIYPAQAALTTNRELRCLSAFNGLALYRASDYAQGGYVTETPAEICEHLTFNRAIASASGKSMVVDPGLRVDMPAEHGRKPFLPFWIQRARKLAQRLRPTKASATSA